MRDERVSGTLIRYTANPTKFDTHPYGTLCSVMRNDDGTEHEYFVQTSIDENDPLWMSAGELLASIYKEKLQDVTFIQELLDKHGKSD